jgi:outer membrane protein assembly factor BamB
MVYTAANNRGGTVRLKPTADGMEAEPVYLERGLPSALGGTLLLNGYLYGTNPRALVCAEFATGKIVWQNDALGAGSICYADGHLYVHGEESGAVALIEATPTAYKEKGRFTPPNLPQRGRGEKAWAYPVVANGRLYLRDINRLWCYNIKA